MADRPGGRLSSVQRPRPALCRREVAAVSDQDPLAPVQCPAVKLETGLGALDDPDALLVFGKVEGTGVLEAAVVAGLVGNHLIF